MNRLLLAYFAIGAVGFNKSQVIGRFFSNVSAVSVKDEVATFKNEWKHENSNVTWWKRRSGDVRFDCEGPSEGFQSKMSESDQEKKKSILLLLGDILRSSCPSTYDRLKNILVRDLRFEEYFDLKKTILPTFECLKIVTIQYVDRILAKNSIQLGENAYFVRDNWQDESENGFRLKYSKRMKHIAVVGRDRQKEDTTDEKSTHGYRKHDGCYIRSILARDLISLLYERFDDFLKSHSLKFRLSKHLQVEGRGRRRDHRMLALMVMGFMIMASILIPTGFQFLTVLGGKSLLMAKMALIMSAISGLKKIATSNVGYGFYHTGTNDGHHHDHVHHGFHDKLYQGNVQQGGSYPGVGL